METVSRSHVSFSKVAPTHYHEYAGNYTGKQFNNRSQRVRSIRILARDIEITHPAVESDSRPDNCE